MRGFGTIFNALAIIAGGILGIVFRRFLKEPVSGYDYEGNWICGGISGSGGYLIENAGALG